MPTALVINPNTSNAMTADIRNTAARVFQSPWKVVVENAPAGPESLESWRDYHLASVTVLPLLESHADCDGIVLACFGDPGLFLLKEIGRVPVIGIAEAAMSVAILLGGKFGILAGMRRAVQLMDSMVRTYGLEARYAGTVPLEMRVLEFDQDRKATLQVLEQAGRHLLAQGADVLLLGCAGLTSYVKETKARLGVTIIDPIEAGCRLLIAIVEAGLNVSHEGIYARPAPQRMHNMDSFFNEEMAQLFRGWQAEGEP